MTEAVKEFPTEAGPKRIALVTTELRPGGAERNLTALAVGLDREKFTPHVYSLAPEPPVAQGQLVEVLHDHDVPVSFVGVRRSWQFFTAVRRLRAMLSEQSPDLIQSFLFHANFTSAVAARPMNVPLVGGLRVAQRERWRQFVERNWANRFAAFVCVSQGVADVAADLGGLPRDKLTVIPNGLDPLRFTDVPRADWSQFGIDEGRQVILFVGRFDHQKGVDFLIEAAAEFLPQLPGADLLLVGDGPEKSAIQAELLQRSLQNRVVIAPWQADALPLIAGADLVVAPSRYEGMSNVILEAAALGRVVVATDVEGVRDILGSSSDQQISLIGRTNDFASRVVQLMSQPADRVELGEANRRRVWQKFPLEKTVAAYASLYQRLIRPMC